MTTNAEAVATAARERRFDAELAAVLGADLARFEERGDSANVQKPWLAAALVLLGVAVTVLTAIAAAPDRTPLQGPAIYEPPLLTRIGVPTAGHLALLPSDARSVAMFCHEANRDFAPFARLHEIVAVDVNGPGLEVEWALDCLVPFASLPKLEVLAIPLQPAMTPAHLAVLAKSTSLRSLKLYLRRTLTVDDVRVLAALPRLERLSLCEGTLDAVTVRSLSDLPKLSTLELNAVVTDEAALLQLRSLHLLRALRFEMMGATPIAAPDAAGGIGAGLTPSVAAALRGLPVLESLELQTCEVSVRAIEELPTTLRSFALTRSPDTAADVYVAMQRLVRLQRLAVDGPWSSTTAEVQRVEGERTVMSAKSTVVENNAVQPSQAKLLQALPLVQLDYTGTLSSELRAALATTPSLREVRLHRATLDDVRAVAAVPNLERLVLFQSAKDAGDLECLKAARTLKRLELQYSNVKEVDAERVLPGVTIVVSPN